MSHKLIQGRQLRCRAIVEEPYSDRDPQSIVNNSGMSGEEGIFQTHNTDMDAMWLTVRNPGVHNTITFDFGAVYALGYMLVWNFNQKKYTGAGLRDTKIFYSVDQNDWTELKGKGYPYRFARAAGSDTQEATNLDDGQNSPVDFNGICARYVKLVPHPDQGVGNWGDYIEKQHRYGLSQVRFYAYKPEITAGAVIPCFPCWPRDLHTVVCRNGLYEKDGMLVHGNDPAAMWISETNPLHRSLIFDLDGTYPLDEMRVWNYNEPDNTGAGIKNARIYYSLDKMSWEELKNHEGYFTFQLADGSDALCATNLADGSPVLFHGAMARYVKIELCGGIGNGTWGCYHGFENRFGISKIQFTAAGGYCIEPAREYNGLFSRFHGWSGADGIFMAPIDGVKAQSDDPNKKSLVIFSDTFVGESDPVTHRRKTYDVVNNSMAYFSGRTPYENMRLDFCDLRDAEGTPCGVIPNPEHGKYFYWLQDCTVVNGKLYAFTDNIEEDLSIKQEGFQFRLVGVDGISIDIREGKLALDTLEVYPTPLWTPQRYFGCAILPKHEAAGLPDPDGYLYIYGLYEAPAAGKQLIVARCTPENIRSFASYEFYDSQKWQSDIGQAAPICEEAGSEMSVTPITQGAYQGKYLMVYCGVYQRDMVLARIAETPWGPFGDPVPLFALDLQEEFSSRTEEKVYYYNAKAHYHISKPGELLITHNVNTTDFESNLKNSEIYHPRFLRLHKI